MSTEAKARIPRIQTHRILATLAQAAMTSAVRTRTQSTDRVATEVTQKLPAETTATLEVMQSVVTKIRK